MFFKIYNRDQLKIALLMNIKIFRRLMNIKIFGYIYFWKRSLVTSGETARSEFIYKVKKKLNFYF
jgi:hypothetical protein